MKKVREIYGKTGGKMWKCLKNYGKCYRKIWKDIWKMHGKNLEKNMVLNGK